MVVFVLDNTLVVLVPELGLHDVVVRFGREELKEMAAADDTRAIDFQESPPLVVGRHRSWQ